MLRVLFGVLVCFASLCVAPATQAGILTNGMTNLEDNDWESQVSGLGDGTLDVGDLLLSVIEIQASEEVLGTENGAFDGSLAAGVRTTYTKTTRAITGISVIRVASVVLTSPFSARFTFVGASAAEWLTHSGLVVADGVGAILYDDPASGLANHVDFTTVASGIATATEGSLIAYFTPVGWRADTISFGGTPTSVLAIDSLNFVASLNTTNPLFAPHNILADPDYNGSVGDRAFFAANGPADLQLVGKNGTGSAGGFQLATDTDLYIKIVPEPASFAIFGLMTLGGIAYRRRQSK